MTDTDEDMVLCGRGLDKWYGAKHERRQVLFGVDVDVRAGECLAVIGGSGSGKTTLTRVLLGLESADGGSVEYCGEPVRGDVARKLRMQSGLVFQSPFDSLDPRWRIGRSIGEPLRMHHPDWPRERVAERVAEVLEMVSLDPETYLNRFPVDLSGGQAQRVLIARALTLEPELLIADEPTTALDVTVQAQIVKLLKRINQKKGTAILFISHDLSLVRRLCSRVIVMKDGRIVEQGAMEDIFENPQQEYTQKLIAAIPRCVKKNSGRSAKTEEAHG